MEKSNGNNLNVLSFSGRLIGGIRIPYIKPEDRKRLEADFPRTPGEVNYLVTMRIKKELDEKGLSYALANDIIIDLTDAQFALAQTVRITERAGEFADIAYRYIFEVNSLSDDMDIVVKGGTNVEAVARRTIAARGALECAKLEFARRKLFDYEDKKTRENGDVYDYPSLGNRAWAAGFFEGEGCFYAHYNKPRKNGTKVFRTSANLSQKDRGLLEQFRKVVGFGVLCGPNTSGVSLWTTSKKGEAARLLEMLRPWLGERRISTAERLLATEKGQMFRPLATHCSKGHEYTERNTYLRKNREGNSRVCRTCAREYAKAMRRKL